MKGIHELHPDLRMIPVGLHELVLPRDEESAEESDEQESYATPVVTADELLDQFEDMKTDDEL